MKSYAEFLAETETAEEKAKATRREQCRRFALEIEKHVLPAGLSPNRSVRTIVRSMLDEAAVYPTTLKCDACGLQLVWTMDMSLSQRPVYCGACGFCGTVPRGALIGADWPELPAEGTTT